MMAFCRQLLRARRALSHSQSVSASAALSSRRGLSPGNRGSEVPVSTLDAPDPPAQALAARRPPKPTNAARSIARQSSSVTRRRGRRFGLPALRRILRRVDGLLAISHGLLLVLTVTLSTACGGTQTSKPSGDAPDAAAPGLCGRTLPSCPLDRCAGSHCALVVLAKLVNLGQVYVFGADGEYVYLASDKGLYRVPRCGGPAETLALSTSSFEFAKLAEDSIYFHVSEQAESVFRMPRAGGPSQELNPNADGGSSSIVSVQPVGSDVYVVTGSALSVFPVDGGTLQPVLDGDGFGELAGDAEYVYFHRISATDHGLYRTKSGQLSPELLLSTSADSSFAVSPPAVDADFAYIATGSSAGADLNRIAKGTRVATVVAALDDAPREMASDGHCVYFALDAHNVNGYRTLHRIPAGGGKSQLLAASALGFALDDTAYYFSTGQYVFRSPK